MTISVNKAQHAALRACRDKPYGIVAASTARALVGKGLADYATVDPAPVAGLAISLTIKGRSLV